MRRDISRFVNREFDIVVIGGGVFGISIAWDAALRGLSVALVERDDFGGATSANPFKMIHGGIRYLQHADLRRIRESARERRFFLRAAPHLTRPLPIVVPTYSRGLERKSLLRAAFFAYAALTLDRNRGISDPVRKIPGGSILSREECLAMFPGMEHDDLTGAGVFYDGQMYDPPRLALAMLKSAVASGATAANYLEVNGFLREGNRINGVTAIDRLNSSKVQIRGRLVVNAAGAWANHLLRDQLNAGLDPAPTFSRDAFFIVKKRLLDKCALAMPGWTEDPDAVMSRGKRHLFAVPWHDCTLFGVWHVVYSDHPDRFTVTRQELQHFIDEVNDAYPTFQLSLSDVSAWNAGLVLFGDNAAGGRDLSYGKRSIVVDHAREGLEGLLTVIGVRWTTARAVAEDVVNRVYGKLRMVPQPSKTETSTVSGGEFENFEDLVSQLRQHDDLGVDRKVFRSLAHKYGTEAHDLLERVVANSHLGQRLGASNVLWAEVIHAVEEEMAQNLTDVALRRTGLATAGHPGQEAIQESASLLSSELGWSPSRFDREVKALLRQFPSLQSQRRTEVNALGQ